MARRAGRPWGRSARLAGDQVGDRFEEELGEAVTGIGGAAPRRHLQLWDGPSRTPGGGVRRGGRRPRRRPVVRCRCGAARSGRGRRHRPEVAAADDVLNEHAVLDARDERSAGAAVGGSLPDSSGGSRRGAAADTILDLGLAAQERAVCRRRAWRRRQPRRRTTRSSPSSAASSGPPVARWRVACERADASPFGPGEHLAGAAILDRHLQADADEVPPRARWRRARSSVLRASPGGARAAPTRIAAPRGRRAGRRPRVAGAPFAQRPGCAAPRRPRAYPARAASCASA